MSHSLQAGLRMDCEAFDNHVYNHVFRVDGIASVWRFVGNLSFEGSLKLQNIYSQLARWYALGMKDVSSLREGAFRSGRADNYLSFKSEVQTLAGSTPSSSNLAEWSLARSKHS